MHFTTTHALTRTLAALLGGVVMIAAATRVVAGEVNVAASGTTLKITGSPDADVIKIYHPAMVPVFFILIEPGPGTTLTGLGGLFNNPDFTDVKIAMGDGADVVTIESLSFTGKLQIKTGKGSDRVHLLHASFAGGAKIDLGADNNALVLCSSTLTPTLAIKYGAPDDTQIEAKCGSGQVNPGGNRGTAITLNDVDAGAVSIKGGKGYDGVALQTSRLGPTKLALGSANALAICNVAIDGNLDVNLGGGGTDQTGQMSCPAPDLFLVGGESALAIGSVAVSGALKVKTGKGGDGISLSNLEVDGMAKVDTGAGANELRFFTTTLHQDLTTKSGNGPDDVEISAAFVTGNVKVTLGAGENDLVSFISNVAGDLTVKAGKDADTIDTSGILVGGVRTVNGGGGLDTIN